MRDPNLTTATAELTAPTAVVSGDWLGANKIMKLNREQWIAAAKAELIKIQCYDGQVLTPIEELNFQNWAETLADDTSGNYYADGYTPEAAVWEELSYA